MKQHILTIYKHLTVENNTQLCNVPKVQKYSFISEYLKNNIRAMVNNMIYLFQYALVREKNYILFLKQ